MAISNTADLFNQLFGTFTTLAILVSTVVFGLITYLLIRYRARSTSPEPDDAPQLGRIPAERGHLKSIVVSVTLSSIILGVLIFGTLVVTNQILTVPSECIPKPGQCMYITVRAFRFGWNFTYDGNGVTRGNLTVPINMVVVLRIESHDVFHSFGIDEFRLKRDAVPGLTNTIWFKATEQGVHLDAIRCFEYCGVGHKDMKANLSLLGQGSCSVSGC